VTFGDRERGRDPGKRSLSGETGREDWDFGGELGDPWGKQDFSTSKEG